MKPMRDSDDSPAPRGRGQPPSRKGRTERHKSPPEPGRSRAERRKSPPKRSGSQGGPGRKAASSAGGLTPQEESPPPVEKPPPPAGEAASESGGQAPARKEPRQPPPPLKRDVARLHKALAWWVGQLIKERYELRMEQAAALAKVGKRTLEEYVAGRHPDAWTTFEKTVLGLGKRPEKLQVAVRCWIRARLRQEKRRHQGEPDWRMRWPWEQKSCQRKRDESRYPNGPGGASSRP